MSKTRIYILGALTGVGLSAAVVGAMLLVGHLQGQIDALWQVVARLHVEQHAPQSAQSVPS